MTDEPEKTAKEEREEARAAKADEARFDRIEKAAHESTSTYETTDPIIAEQNQQKK